MENPLVTVGVISYNNAGYLTECLESIKRQSYDNIELIIVDDCSTDNSVLLAKEWVKTFGKPVQIIIHEKNKGVCATYNTVLENAKGKYLSTLDSDDIYMPDKLKIQVDILEKSGPEVCAVYSDAYMIKEDGSPRYGWFMQKYKDFEDAPTGNIYESLMKGDLHLHPGAATFKLGCFKDIGKYDESLVYQDYDMALRMAQKYSFIFSEYPSLKYRIRKSSIRHTVKNWNPTGLRIYMKHLEGVCGGIAIKHIEVISSGAYRNDDKESRPLAMQCGNLSSYLKLVTTLWALRVPKLIGTPILKLIDKARMNKVK